MKMIKKINAAFSSCIVCLFYILGIGFAWMLHLASSRPQKKSESFWTLIEKKRLPKQYFSSPF